MSSADPLQALADNATATRDRAVVRACFVQGKIACLRDHLENSPLCRDADQTYDDVPNAALLASYDAEMNRLCQIPGVLSALLAEMVIEEAP